jgi:hypothetical protein
MNENGTTKNFEMKKMEQTSTKMKQLQIEWRRSKVLELSAKGNNQAEISRILNIPKTTINRDIDYLRTLAKENIKQHIEERLPYEFEQCLQGITQIIQQAWNISENAGDKENKREKLQSLSLAKDCYSIKMDLLTNTNLLKDSINFVEQSKKEKIIEYKKIEQEIVRDKEEKEEDDDLQRSTEDNSSKRNYNSIF